MSRSSFPDLSVPLKGGEGWHSWREKGTCVSFRSQVFGEMAAACVWREWLDPWRNPECRQPQGVPEGRGRVAQNRETRLLARIPGNTLGDWEGRGDADRYLCGASPIKMQA